MEVEFRLRGALAVEGLGGRAGRAAEGDRVDDDALCLHPAANRGHPPVPLGLALGLRGVDTHEVPQPTIAGVVRAVRTAGGRAAVRARLAGSPATGPVVNLVVAVG